MKKITIDFERSSPVIEKGRAILWVDDPTDVEEIQQKMATNDFVSFVIIDRVYTDIEWDWETVEDAK